MTHSIRPEIAIVRLAIEKRLEAAVTPDQLLETVDGLNVLLLVLEMLISAEVRFAGGEVAFELDEETVNSLAGIDGEEQNVILDDFDLDDDDLDDDLDDEDDDDDFFDPFFDDDDDLDDDDDDTDLEEWI